MTQLKLAEQEFPQMVGWNGDTLDVGRLSRSEVIVAMHGNAFIMEMQHLFGWSNTVA